ncbi:ABC transporter substrate-binding protein [Shewanella baltica]|uniref:ABC transporter substrate-binding protein n=1 Tax=Shewanella TaxID=22 RepID=UPI000903A195|nr:ABC transporter substrate-binding protein [Shewanella sp. SACH]OUS50664.1 ABC transporter substrate-binding protein [Shewanella sp. SACH]
MFSHFITLCIFSVLFLHSILTPAYAADDAVINAGGKRQMTAYLGEIPGLINADGTGPFVELVKAIDRADPEVEIDIKVFPLSRAMLGVTLGRADFGLPAIRNNAALDALPYRFSSVSFGQVTHVLYTNVDKPITKAMLFDQQQTGRVFTVEAIPDYMPIPAEPSITIKRSLLKLSHGRIDAFVWAQEEADMMLKQLKLHNIHREDFGDFEDVFVIAKGPEGDAVDAYLTRMIELLRQTGELSQIYQTIHLSYNDWQP